MATLEIPSNVKCITSGQIPTTTNLKDGEFAFGKVGGVAKLYGNVNGVIIDFTGDGGSADLEGVDLNTLVTASTTWDQLPAIVYAVGKPCYAQVPPQGTLNNAAKLIYNNTDHLVNAGSEPFNYVLTPRALIANSGGGNPAYIIDIYLILAGNGNTVYQGTISQATYSDSVDFGGWQITNDVKLGNIKVQISSMYDYIAIDDTKIDFAGADSSGSRVVSLFMNPTTGSLRLSATNSTGYKNILTDGNVKTLFGNQSIYGSGNIDLYRHIVWIRNETSGHQIYITVHIISSSNTPIDSLTDLFTVLSSFANEWYPCNGRVNIDSTNRGVAYNFNARATSNGAVAFLKQNGTEGYYEWSAHSTGLRVSDTVTTV